MKLAFVYKFSFLTFIALIVFGHINKISLEYDVLISSYVGRVLNYFLIAIGVIAPFMLLLKEAIESKRNIYINIIRFVVVYPIMVTLFLVFGSQSFFSFGDSVTIAEIDEQRIGRAALLSKDSVVNHGTHYEFNVSIDLINKHLTVPVSRDLFGSYNVGDTLNLKYFLSDKTGISIKYGEVISNKLSTTIRTQN